jgi:hypothetical protein
LELGAVRLENTGVEAPDALTLSRQIDRLKTTLSGAPAALQQFETLIKFAGWDEDADSERNAVRLSRIDWHEVNSDFPRLTHANTPRGVVDASYVVLLPSPPGA